MSISASEMTPADIAAVTNNNCGRNGDGFGWGGDWTAWIILFFIFGMFGFGNGAWGGGFGSWGDGSSVCPVKYSVVVSSISAIFFKRSHVILSLPFLILLRYV